MLCAATPCCAQQRHAVRSNAMLCAATGVALQEAGRIRGPHNMINPRCAEPGVTVVKQSPPDLADQTAAVCARFDSLTVASLSPDSPSLSGSSDRHPLERLMSVSLIADRIATHLDGQDLFQLRHCLPKDSPAFESVTALQNRRAPQEVALLRALHCLSCPKTDKDQDLLDALDDQRQLSTFARGPGYKAELSWQAIRLPFPDFAADSPLDCVLQCQLIDKTTGKRGPRDSCTHRILRLAMTCGNVAVGFKMLRGLQQAQERGLLDTRWLTNKDGQTLLERMFYYEDVSCFSLWLRLVLAAGIFDVNAGESSPLYLAILKAPDADAVAALLEAGAEPDRGNDRLCKSPLNLCVESDIDDQARKLQQLLACDGVDVNRPHATGYWQGPPLFWAVFSGSLCAVTQLLAHPDTRIDRLYLVDSYHVRLGRGSLLALAACRIAAHFLLSAPDSATAWPQRVTVC